MKRQPDYHLRQGETLLGSLVETDLDFPWTNCEFEATADFEPMRAVFEREAAALDAIDDADGGVTQYEEALTAVDALKLSLEDCRSLVRHTEFLLHIRGNVAWFRI